MRQILVSCFALTLLLVVAGCKGHKSDDSMDSMKTSSDSSMSSMATTMPSAMYTCTMHPEVVTSAPGKCPKCGMDLVAKK